MKHNQKGGNNENVQAFCAAIEFTIAANTYHIHHITALSEEILTKQKKKGVSNKPSENISKACYIDPLKNYQKSYFKKK